MRISKEARLNAQQNSLPKTHRVKEFPQRRHLHEAGRKELGSVPKNADLNRGQHWFEEIPVAIPVDVSPTKFKGELDDQLVPMEVEEVVVRKVGDQRRKTLARNLEGTIKDVGQARPKRGKAQSDVVNGLLELPLTLSLQEIASISPSVRRDLAMTLKAIRDDQPEDFDGARFGDQKEPEALGEEKVMKGRKSEGLSEIPKEVFLGSSGRVGGREARGDLLKIEITIGNATMVGVVDSGSMINMISAKKLEESGLPSVALKEKSFKITGVNGGTSRCHSWIPGATIYVSKDKKATFGNVYILEDADFEFIAGRPWSTLNGGKIEERTRGTYVSWVTDETRYELNVLKASESAVRAADAQAHLSQKEEGENEEPITALTVRVGDEDEKGKLCVPDSQEEREELDYGDDDNGLGNRYGLPEGNQQAQEEIERWARGGEDSDGEEEQETESYKSSPPKSKKGKERQREESTDDEPDRPSKKTCVRQHQKQRIIVDQDLEEGFSRLVQTGANEEEWEIFCGKEKRRLAHGDQRWFNWMDSDNEDYASPQIKDPSQAQDHKNISDEGSSSAVLHNSPREESQTLRTPPKFNPKPVKTPVRKVERSVTTEVVGRRSSRLKQETTCSTCGGAPMNQQKTYQRKERASRTVSKRITARSTRDTKREDNDPKIVSYGLRTIMKDEGSPEQPKKKLVGGKHQKEITIKEVHRDSQKSNWWSKGSSPQLPPAPKESLESRVICPLPRRTPEGPPQNVLGSVRGAQRIPARQLSALCNTLGRQKQETAKDAGSGENMSITDLGGIQNTAREEIRSFSPQDPRELGPWQNVFDEQNQGSRKETKGKKVMSPPRSHKPYLTWTDGNCSLHIPDE